MAEPPARCALSIVYLDCIVVKVRQDQRVINKSIYLALGVNLDGHKELLGLWLAETEGDRLQHTLTGLQSLRLDIRGAAPETKSVFSITRAGSRFLCRFLAATLLLTQFSLLAQASTSVAAYPSAHPVNCSESMGTDGKQKDTKCPVQVCLQNLTQADKAASVISESATNAQFIQPVLFVVPLPLSSSQPPQQLVSLQNNEPPLAIRFCSFQI